MFFLRAEPKLRHKKVIALWKYTELVALNSMLDLGGSFRESEEIKSADKERPINSWAELLNLVEIIYWWYFGIAGGEF